MYLADRQFFLFFHEVSHLKNPPYKYQSIDKHAMPFDKTDQTKCCLEAFVKLRQDHQLAHTMQQRPNLEIIVCLKHQRFE